MVAEAQTTQIPGRAETLAVLHVMYDGLPMLLLPGDGCGYGARWVLDGQSVQPAIATYLMESGYIVETGRTEFGAVVLRMTPDGVRFSDAGQRWWRSLSLLARLRVRFFG